MKTCSDESTIETFGPEHARHYTAYDSRLETCLSLGEPLFDSMLMIVLKNPGCHLKQVACNLSSRISKVKNLYNDAVMHGFIRARRTDTVEDPELYPTFKLWSYLGRLTHAEWLYDYDVVDEEGIFHFSWDDVF